MSTRFKGFALLAILVGAAGVMPVFASPYAVQSTTDANSTNSTLGNTVPSSNDAITVTTDKPSYNDGDKVTISGSTRDYISETPVTVMIRNPVGNIIKIDQVELGTDRTYSTTVTAGGALWQAAGTYEVLVQFGSKDRSVQTTFQFSGSSGGFGNTIQVDGTNMTVKYSITNGKVLGIKADTQSKSLIVAIQTTGNGVLTITLPRALIDSKNSGGVDEQYVVLTDGQESMDFQETTTTATERTLTIPFEDGTQEIEIIGTQIVPEFGPIAALVLAIAIVSIIAVSAKTGLRLMPRY